ncbi:transcriptional repressor AgaR [Reichenbachiella agarivorans]|uniref:Transcriptional repressor AgaR n=1 Tax=Reichenbachiella agarivorans TaxID=2979464 RepID=A0ABY6CQD3_9BACT|nr:transcriptional repressor AgaR [Reichenbachiella agarivorans]UXP32245.1 transcriptional repressor AgaR [Reichenbachiella agarivorans]
MPINTRSSTVSRRNDILTAIHADGKVFVEELSSRFGVSEVTIRNDLDQLEQKNLLIRARGGAMKIEGRVGVDYNLSEKDKLNYNEKVKIGRAAANLISDSEIILIDSGTTTAEMVKNLNGIKDLTVITNALNIAGELINNPNVSLTIPGGYLRKNSQSLVGPMAERGLKNFYVDKAFLGVDGFDTKTGLYTPNIEEAHLNELMIEIANEVILLTDSSKFKKKSFAYICPVDRIDVVVTDDKIDNEDRRRLEDAGVKVIIA